MIQIQVKKIFLSIFNPNKPIEEPIKWIKQTTRAKIQTNKKALLELLELIGVSFSERKDKKKLSACFCDKSHNPIIYNGGNYQNLDIRSEYFSLLSKLTELLKP